MNLKNLEYIKKNAPATKEEIENVEKHINGVLPNLQRISETGEWNGFGFVCIIRYAQNC